MTINVGLVGYGVSGSLFHAPFIAGIPAFKLHSIVSSQAERVQRIHQDYPDVVVHPTFEALLMEPDIQLIVITSANSAHYEQARQSILAGKHVVVEKPFVIHSADGEALAELARQHHVILSVYQNRRWDGDFLTVRGVLSSGMLGQISSYEAHFDRFRPLVQDRWRERGIPGSGTLYDLGSHLIDQALFLFGRPLSVWADLQQQREHAQAIDYFHLVLHYAHHEVILHSSSLVRAPGPHFQVHGHKGSFIKYGLDPQEDALRAGARPLSSIHWGKDAPELYGELSADMHGLAFQGKVETLAGCYEAYYKALADAIVAHKPVPVRPEEATATIRIIELALKSQQEQRVIPISTNE